VSQPWCTIGSRVVNVIAPTPRKPIAIAGTVSVPRRADARRFCRTCVCAPRMSLFFSEPASCTKSGWRKPAVVHRRTRSAKSARIRNYVTEPRRADGRRSRERAFEHRECRYFSTDRHRALGAPGVSQPWS